MAALELGRLQLATGEVVERGPSADLFGLRAEVVEACVPDVPAQERRRVSLAIEPILHAQTIELEEARITRGEGERDLERSPAVVADALGELALEVVETIHLVAIAIVEHV